MGYAHQLSGQVLSHHHANCAEHCGHDDHSETPNGDSPSGDNSSCHCDQCHLVSATVEILAPFAFSSAVSALDNEANLRGPAADWLPLDRPPKLS